MTRRELESRQQFESALYRETQSNTEAYRLAQLLMRHGRTYARIQEMVCNGVEWYQHDTNETFNKRQARHEAYTEKREGQLERRITTICKELGAGFEPVFSGDPRGCTVKIRVPSGRTNDMGQEGICVPTA